MGTQFVLTQLIRFNYRLPGDRRFIATLTKAALAAGANALFIEAHPFPSKAKSDAATVFSFEELDFYLPIFKQLYDMMQVSPNYNYHE